MVRKSRRHGPGAGKGRPQESRIQAAASRGSSDAAADGLLPCSAVVVNIGRFGLTVRQVEIGVVVVITAVAGILLFANLSDQYLWQDEAETALIARTVLTDGLPRGHDDKNSFSQKAGREYGPDGLSRLHAWLPFYLLAGFFAVLGENTLVARLPFALLGLASIPLSYFFARLLWQSRRAAALAAILLGTSVPYLILSRQCRYYSPSAFFTLLGLFAYCQMVQRKRWAAPFFIVAAVLLFHSHYPYWAVLLASVLVHVLIYHRDRFAAVALGSLCTFLLILPYLVWLLSSQAAGPHSGVEFSLIRPFAITWQYVLQILQYVFSPVLIGLLFVMGIVGGIRRRRFPLPSPLARQGTMLLVLFVAFNVIVLSWITPLYFFRYVAPAIPVLCVLAARILDSAMRLNPAIGIAGLAAILFLSPIRDYAYEITHHYRSPTEGIVTYLNKHGKPEDVVAITYGDLPVKFYTRMRVVGGLTGEDLAPALKADWVIIRHNVVCKTDYAVARYLWTHLRTEDYKRIDLDSPDIPWDNRESPDQHHYRTVTGAPLVMILQRIVQ
jgi:hypothetical protein